MSFFNDLTAEQARQSVDTEQVYLAYEEARRLLAGRYGGSMVWKTVSGRDYLHRKIGRSWRSLGLRSEDTEQIYRSFGAGRTTTHERAAGTAKRLDEMAPVNRALRLGRLPTLSARIIRRISEAGWLDRKIQIVGTNALYAYERAGGVHIRGDYLATGDIDLLIDGRAKLKLAAAAGKDASVLDLLTKVDKSFVRMGNTFRAVNRDGFMVHLLTPAGSDPARPSPFLPDTNADDLQAVEMTGLAWLVNAPKFAAVVIAEDGYPVRMVSPDPRAFAIHKLWLSRRADRDPAKRGRDEVQARLVADILRRHLPSLDFDSGELKGVPLSLLDDLKALVPAAVLDDPAAVPAPGWS
jgi:hypothetical protein